MADIPQWRRKIPPSRSRTPMLEFTEPDQDVRSAASTRPSTPKKGLRPKLSSYLSQSGPFGTTTRSEPEPVFSEILTQSFPSWAIEDTFPHPSAEQLIDTILCRLMSQPYDALDTRFNGALLQIFEAYRNLSDQRERLERSLAGETDNRLVERSAAQRAELGWEEEKQSYKAEVKRLELVIAQDKRGVADVALVRQDSLIRRKKQVITPEDEDDGKETVFEFLEKTKRFEDPAWSGQRATMRIRPASPSARMVKLSKKLTKKVSKTSILAELPFGIPPAHAHSNSLLQASYLEDQDRLLSSEKKPAESRSQTKEEVRVSFSDDTLSTFSCAGDLLPDEANEKEVHHVDPAFEHVSDNVMEDIRRMAATISNRRGIDIETVMPRLLDLFRPQEPTNDAQAQRLNHAQLQRVATAPITGASNTTTFRKPSHLMGFFNRLRPQLSLDTLPEARRFSFEVGDDKGPIGAAYQQSASRESLLRKSVSLSALHEAARPVPARPSQNDLSPIECSPTTSTRTNDSRRTSKIPSPTYNATLAKPRQQREESASSLLTAMRDAEHPGKRSSSAASSVYSTQSRHHVATDKPRIASRTLLTQPSQAIVNRLDLHRLHGFSSVDAAGTAPSRQLIDHTNAVRAGTSIGGSTMSAGDGGSADNIKQHSSMRSGSVGRSRTAQNASMQRVGVVSENAHPFLYPRGGGNEEDTVA